MTATPDWVEANSLLAMLESSKPAAILVDRELREHNSCATAQDWLQRLGMRTEVHEIIPYQDHLAAGAAGRDLASDSSVVVAVGGGATIDWAKLSLFLASANNEMVASAFRDRSGIVVLPGTVRRSVPLVVIPTTFGTGAEVSTVSVYLGGGDRRLVVSKGLIPDASVIDTQGLATLPRHMIGEGILEIIARLSNPYVDEQADIGLLSDDIVETLLARLIALASRPGLVEDPTADDLGELARISRASHDRSLARMTNRVPLLWALSNELVDVTGLRKMEASARIWGTLWSKVLADGDRYGSAERLHRLWQVVHQHAVSPLSSDPVVGLADLQRLLQLPVESPEVSSHLRHQAATQAMRRWGAGLPFLRGLSYQEIDSILADSFNEPADALSPTTKTKGGEI